MEKNVCLKILCVYTKFLRVLRWGERIKVKVGGYSEKWDDEKGSTEREYVDYHGGSKYNKGW